MVSFQDMHSVLFVICRLSLFAFCHCLSLFDVFVVFVCCCSLFIVSFSFLAACLLSFVVVCCSLQCVIVCRLLGVQVV